MSSQNFTYSPKRDVLNSYTRPREDYGPTQTRTVQIRFEQRLRGVLGRINAAIKRGIIKDDILNLREKTDTLAVDDPGPFETDQTESSIAQFVQWLRNQLDNEFLEVVGPNENPFIRAAYSEGLRLATSQLQEADIPLSDVDISGVIDQGRFDRALQTLFTRTYENLESVSDAIVSDVRENLLEGWRDGENPTKIANRITNRIDSIGKHRATLIARSEIINAHTEAALDRYEQASEDTGTDIAATHVGRLTAHDPDVCAFCRRAEDSTFTTSEFRSTLAVFRGQEYRLAPPSHPNCRCTVNAVIGVNEDELAPLSERVPGRLVL